MQKKEILSSSSPLVCGWMNVAVVAPLSTGTDRGKLCVWMRMNVDVVAPLWPHVETDAKCAFVCGWMSMSLHLCDHTMRQRENVRLYEDECRCRRTAVTTRTDRGKMCGWMQLSLLLLRRLPPPWPPALRLSSAIYATALFWLGRGGLLRPALPPYSGFHFFCHQDLRWFKFSEPFVFFPLIFLLVFFILWGGGSEGGGGGGGGGEKAFANIREV